MDTVDPTRFIFAFIFVVGLIGLLGLGLKRFGAKSGLIPRNEGRLQLVEMRPIDGKRKLVLVKRDDREHLLLLADGRELLIESNIPAAMMAQPRNEPKLS